MSGGRCGHWVTNADYRSSGIVPLESLVLSQKKGGDTLKLRKLSSFVIAVCLLVSSASLCFAQAPEAFDAGAFVEDGGEIIGGLILNVAPYVLAAMAIVLGWKYGLKLFKRLGKSL